MRWRSLDNITRSLILQAGYPMHWYLQFLKYAADCLREITFDSLRVVNTQKIALSEGNIAPLPCDYVDWVRVGMPIGQYVRPLSQSDLINRLHNYDSAGEIAEYGEKQTESYIDNIAIAGFNWVRTNEYNENTGRLFGMGSYPSANGFKVLRERDGGEIQFDDQTGMKAIILEYISDGQTIDNATKVHPYAQATIEAYIIWKMKHFGRHYSRQEAMLAKAEFDQLHKNLRSRLNKMTITDIKNIIRGGYAATYKA